MANYKKIVDVDVLAEASESTNVLVEENGSLKKVPAASMGGGETIVFRVDGDNVATCSHSFADAYDLIASAKASVLVSLYLIGVEMYSLVHGVESIYYDFGDGNKGILLRFNFYEPNGSMFTEYLNATIEYRADGTLVPNLGY